MNSIERYLGKTILVYTFIVLMVLTMILGLVELMYQLSKTGTDFTAQHALLFTALKLPFFAYDTYAVAMLIGALMGLGSLSNRSELIILRVTGWSVNRIFIAVLKTVFLIWLFFAVLGEWLAPKSEAYAQKMRAEALHHTITIGSTKDFWMKDQEGADQRFIYVDKILNDRRLQGIEIYEVSAEGLSQKITATDAYFQEGESWRLQNVSLTDVIWHPADFKIAQVPDFKQMSVKVLHENERLESLPISPDMLNALRVGTRMMNIVDLKYYIHFLKENNLDAEPYVLEFWRKIMAPFSILGMIALVFPLIFGSRRAVSMGQRVFIGIIIGLTFQMLNQIFGNLSVVYQVPAFFGAATPSLLMILLGFYLFKKVR